MTGRVVATLPERFAASVLIAALCTFGPGCSQLLGITGITAAADASTNDATGDGGSSNDTAIDQVETAGDQADTVGDRSSTDDVADRSSSDSQNSPDATSCYDGLSNVHTGDFLISFTMQTDQPDNFIGLVDQRTICVNGLFWDAWLVAQHVRLELSDSTDNSRYAALVSTGAALNDNNPHDVVITRTNSVVIMVIDGHVVGSKTMDQNLGSLPPLLIGSGKCPGVVTINHAITNFCVRPN